MSKWCKMYGRLSLHAGLDCPGIKEVSGTYVLNDFVLEVTCEYETIYFSSITSGIYHALKSMSKEEFFEQMVEFVNLLKYFKGKQFTQIIADFQEPLMIEMLEKMSFKPFAKTLTGVLLKDD